MDEIKIKGLQPTNISLTTPKELKMVEDKKTVENLCTALGFIVSISNDLYKVTAEDSSGGAKVTTAEYLEFLPEAFKIPKVIEAIKNIPAEVFDLITDAEIQQIADTLGGSLYFVDNGKLFDIVKRALIILNEIKNLVQDLAV